MGPTQAVSLATFSQFFGCAWDGMEVSESTSSKICDNDKIRNKMRSRSFESFCTILSPHLALTSSLGGIFQHRTDEKTILAFSMRNYCTCSANLLVLPLLSRFPSILGHLSHTEWEKTRGRKDIGDKTANFCNSPDMSLATFLGCGALPKNAENKSDARLYRLHRVHTGCRDYRLHRGETTTINKYRMASSKQMFHEYHRWWKLRCSKKWKCAHFGSNSSQLRKYAEHRSPSHES